MLTNEIETTLCSRITPSRRESETSIFVRAPRRILVMSPDVLPPVERRRPLPLSLRARPARPTRAEPKVVVAPSLADRIEETREPRRPAASATSSPTSIVPATAPVRALPGPVSGANARTEPAAPTFLFLAGVAAGLALALVFGTMSPRSGAEVRFDLCSGVATFAGFRCTE